MEALSPLSTQISKTEEIAKTRTQSICTWNKNLALTQQKMSLNLELPLQQAVLSKTIRVLQTLLSSKVKEQAMMKLGRSIKAPLKVETIERIKILSTDLILPKPLTSTRSDLVQLV